MILVGGYKLPNAFDMREGGVALEVGLCFEPGALAGGHDPTKHYGVRYP